ncbi:MAG: NAD(P)/FAD-dependent oxidoreductase [Minisyncoccia bacterium]
MQKNIVILGAGFGGLQAALRLSKKLKYKDLNEKYSVILIDRNPFHTLTPLLYEIAATSPETASNLKLQDLVSFSINALVAYRHIGFMNDEVAGIDAARKKIRLSRSEIDFEYLINALGSEVNYFDIPGLKENALVLKTFGNALKIRDRIHYKEKARVIIGGGGPTGVELAGEIKSWNIGAEVTIVESAPRILAAMDERVSKKAERRLKKLGVSIIAGTKIIKASSETVFLSNGDKKDCDAIIWTGGVKANSLMGNRIETPGNTNVSDNIYAIGDISSIINPETKKPAPWMARPAMTEGRIAALNIFQKILLEEKIMEYPKFREYKHRNYPYIAPVGGKYAIAKIGPFIISGLPAWIFKGFTELNYFISIMPISQALKVWFKGLIIFIKNDRLG